MGRPPVLRPQLRRDSLGRAEDGNGDGMALLLHQRPCGTLLLTAAIAIACTRYEYVNELDLPECKNRPVPILTDAGPVTHPSPDTTAWFQGVVVSMDDGEPLQDAHVQILGDDSPSVLTDSSGQFAFTGRARHGPVRLAIRRIAYAQYSDTLTVPLPLGVRWRVALAATPVDGPCSGFAAVRVRKPWWKFW